MLLKLISTPLKQKHESDSSLCLDTFIFIYWFLYIYILQGSVATQLQDANFPQNRMCQ